VTALPSASKGRAVKTSILPRTTLGCSLNKAIAALEPNAQPLYEVQIKILVFHSRGLLLP
jgi:hypothetical protein